VPHDFCPIAATLDLLNARWTLHIVHSLLAKPMRFNEIARELNVNPRTLCQRLRELEEAGIVERRVISEVPPNVEYRMTEKGQALSSILESLEDWGKAWMDRKQPAVRP
jgi:DNA-binding HxlR family transcriptional regulator